MEKLTLKEQDEFNGRIEEISIVKKENFTYTCKFDGSKQKGKTFYGFTISKQEEEEFVTIDA